jgi:predicted membrane channel-forming protein YqfA (hemolysin III family)
MLFAGLSMAISAISTIFNILNFEKYRYVRIVGFLFQTILALYIIYKSLIVLPFVAFALLLVAVIAFIVGFIFHIFGYQLSYLNSVGHMFVLTGNTFLFFVILLYII